jgi:hypothetical protein
MINAIKNIIKTIKFNYKSAFYNKTANRKYNNKIKILLLYFDLKLKKS